MSRCTQTGHLWEAQPLLVRRGDQWIAIRKCIRCPAVQEQPAQPGETAQCREAEA